MALFQGEDIINVTTPDGRTMQLPRSAVPSSLMPQQIGPAPIAPGLAGGPQAAPEVADPGPASVMDALASPPVPAAPAAPADVPLDKSTAPVTMAEVAKSNKAYDQKRSAVAAYNASPTGQIANVEARQERSIGDEMAARQKQADIEGASQKLIATATEARNQKIDDLFKQQAKDAQENAAAVQQKTDEVVSLRKMIAGTRIDRSLDHPIIASIFATLAGFGSGISGHEVNTADLIYKAIDRKVAAQMSDLDQMAKVYGMTKDELDNLKESGKSKLALSNTLIAGEADKAIRQIQAITARTDSQKTQTTAKIVTAQLEQHAADKQMDAVQHATDYAQKDAAEKGQNNRFYSGLAQSERHHQDDVTLKREEFALNFDKARSESADRLAERQDKAAREAKKDNETRGIFNVNTTAALLTKKGRAMMADADKADTEAAQLEAKRDPWAANASSITTRANALRERARQTRDAAQLDEQVRGPDPVITGKMRDKYTTVQDMTTNVEAINKLYDGPDGGKAYVYNSPEQQEAASRYTQLLMSLKTVQGLGVLSGKDMAQLAKEMGIEPTSDAWTPGNLAAIVGVKLGKDPQGFRRALGSLVKNSQHDVYLEMNGAKYGGTEEELFDNRRPAEGSPESKALANMREEKTPADAEAAVPSGALARVGRFMYQGFHPFTPGPSLDEERKQAANSGSLTRPGLSKQQGVDFDTVIGAYNKGTPDGKRAGDVLAASVGDWATTDPHLAIATMHNLRDYAHGLYDKAYAALPENSPVKQQLDSETGTRVATEGISTSVLAQQLRLSGYADGDVKDELARRVTKKKDPAAMAVLAESITATPPIRKIR